jgi:hypothetical protein
MAARFPFRRTPTLALITVTVRRLIAGFTDITDSGRIFMAEDGGAATAGRDTAGGEEAVGAGMDGEAVVCSGLIKTDREIGC